MTRDEAKQIVRIIRESYPNWKPIDLGNTVDIWAMMLEQDDFDAIKLGVVNYIRNDTSGFAPSIGQVRQFTIKAVVPGMDDTEEMMGLVRKAVSNGNYGYAEEFERLPEKLKLAVGNAENIRAWAALPADQFESVELSHIRKAYRNIAKRYEEISNSNALTFSTLKKLADTSSIGRSRPQLPFETDDDFRDYCEIAERENNGI